VLKIELTKATQGKPKVQTIKVRMVPTTALHVRHECAAVG